MYYVPKRADQSTNSLTFCVSIKILNYKKVDIFYKIDEISKFPLRFSLLLRVIEM